MRKDENKNLEKVPVKKRWTEILGPGLITGASDDDPSGIATYSQAGAQFGYTMLWSLFFTYPLMSAVQYISARIGRVTGRGIASNLRRHYPPSITRAIILILVIANTINLGADIGAMGEAMKLMVGGSALFYASCLSTLAVLLQIFIPYRHYVFILKWLTLALFSYVVTVFMVHVNWGEVLHKTFIPSIVWNKDYFTVLIAVFGTTISPYLFFWQASQEVEDEKGSSDKHPLKNAPLEAKAEIHRIKLDTLIGMAFSNLVAFFIMLATAVTLHLHQITNIQTAAQAAEALRPFAGDFAFFVFTVGIIGTGLLALPVLAGSSAYAVGEIFEWPVGLEYKPHRAKAFYAVLTVGFIIGLGLNFLSLNPMKALLWAAVINGIVSIPVLVMMMLMANNPKVMGDFTLSLRTNILGWLTTLVMLAVVVGLFLSL